MGWRKSIGRALQDGTRRRSHPAASTPSPNSIEILRACRVPMARSQRISPKMQSLISCSGVGSFESLAGKVATLRSQQSRSFARSIEACMGSAPGSSVRIAGLHVGRIAEVGSVEPTYGVGPVRGADRDPKSKGETPDDFRADDIHKAEPKEITKEKAAIAQEEPPDFQAKKMMAEWEKPVFEDADSQREPGDKVFEEETRKLKGSAKKEGDTTGLESDEKVEGQYGAGGSAGKTTRA